MRQRQETGEAEVHEFKQALAQMERKVATNLQQQRLVKSGLRAEVSSSTVLKTSFEEEMRQVKDESVLELQAAHQTAQLEIAKLKEQIAEASQSSYYYIDAGCVSRVSRWLAVF